MTYLKITYYFAMSRTALLVYKSLGDAKCSVELMNSIGASVMGMEVCKGVIPTHELPLRRVRIHSTRTINP